MRIENWLAESARRFGSKTALITPQRRLTYAEFDDSSTRLAAALAALARSHGGAHGWARAAGLGDDVLDALREVLVEAPRA